MYRNIYLKYIILEIILKAILILFEIYSQQIFQTSCELNIILLIIKYYYLCHKYIPRKHFKLFNPVLFLNIYSF